MKLHRALNKNTVLYFGNGLAYGKGFKEAQIVFVGDRFRVTITDGFSTVAIVWNYRLKGAVEQAKKLL